MKNAIIYIIIILSFLLHSCMSYKAIDLQQDSFKVGKIYKIKQEDKFEKVFLKKVNDSSLTVLINKNEKQILITDIKEIKMQKFSILKSIGLLAGTIGTLTLVSLISLSISY